MRNFLVELLLVPAEPICMQCSVQRPRTMLAGVAAMVSGAAESHPQGHGPGTKHDSCQQYAAWFVLGPFRLGVDLLSLDARRAILCLTGNDEAASHVAIKRFIRTACFVCKANGIVGFSLSFSHTRAITDQD